MRTAPNDPDGASGVYVTAFQVGIMAGSLLGGLFYEQAGLALMVGASTALMAFALGGVWPPAACSQFVQVTSRK